MNPDLIVSDLNKLSREEWLIARRKGIGASESAGVLGWSPWSSPWQVWLDKVGAVPTTDEQNEAMYFGTLLEDAIATAYAERTGMEMSDPKATYRHPVLEWMLASPDRFLYSDHHEGVGILEAKNTSAYNADEWQSAAPDADGVYRGGEAPLHYIVQVQHQHAVLGTQWGYLVALLGGNRLCIVEVPRDDEFIGMLEPALETFWHDHVLANSPPPMDGLETTAELLTQLYGDADPTEVVDLDARVVQAVADYHEAHDFLKDAEDSKRMAGNKLRDALGNATAGTYGGVQVVTWKAQATERFDQTAFRNEHPELFAKFTKTSTSRVLRPGRSKAALEALSQITDGE